MLPIFIHSFCVRGNITTFVYIIQTTNQDWYYNKYRIMAVLRSRQKYHSKPNRSDVLSKLSKLVLFCLLVISQLI